MGKRLIIVVIVFMAMTGIVMSLYERVPSELITDRIDVAISEFVKEYGSIQHHISLPKKEFHELMDYANVTELGRSFTKYGLAYCTLPVTMNTGTEILICPEIVWE